MTKKDVATKGHFRAGNGLLQRMKGDPATTVADGMRQKLSAHATRMPKGQLSAPLNWKPPKKALPANG